MTGRMKLYIGLLALGVVLVGGGLWFLLNSPPRIDVPEGEPVVAMNITNFAGGTASQLAIYEDGTVIYRENDGFRREAVDLDYPATSTWRTGNLQEEEIDNLVDFFRNSHFDELDTYYQSPGAPDPDEWGATDFIVSFNYGDLNKTVRAFGYLTPIGSVAPPEMPYPLDEIHKRLMDIVENRTKEIYRETF